MTYQSRICTWYYSCVPAVSMLRPIEIVPSQAFGGYLIRISMILVRVHHATS
jgi:hypothetical protein